MIKATPSSVIGIGNSLVVMRAAKRNKWPDFFVMESCGVKSTDIHEVGLIHSRDEIMVFQVGGLDLAGRSVNPIAVLDQAFRHPGVGRGTLMMTDGAGGIDDEIMLPSRLFAHLSEDDLSRRRATNISHADKQNAVRAMGHVRHLDDR